MNILVKLSTAEDMKKLTAQFRAIDLDGTGLIHPHEIKKYIESNNMNIKDKEVDALISELDYAGNGKINYSEFLAATVDA